MLVLTRNVEEAIILSAGDTEVRILICGMKYFGQTIRGQVKVGIDAPATVNVRREELPDTQGGNDAIQES